MYNIFEHKLRLLALLILLSNSLLLLCRLEISRNVYKKPENTGTGATTRAPAAGQIKNCLT